ncbi:MAG: hypothetical protein IJK27_05225 [Bacilli bacterium]|nr:hypothetical protein [Bacilli bacterium]
MQYVDAIRYYLLNTHYPIVFAENSGADISCLFEDAIKSGRMEYISFYGNQNKERGKGYGECEIIQYALEHSFLINKSNCKYIVKITGRLKIKNIKTLISFHTFLSWKHSTICSINSNFSFPDSRIIIASKEFYYFFLKKKEYIDDTKGYFFEHALCDTLKEYKKFPFSPFIIQPQIEGISGSTGNTYNNKKTTLISSLKYARYTISQLRRFKKLYRDSS